MILKVKENATNRVTLYNKFNYAFRNYYTDNFYEEEIHPTQGSQQNSYTYFLSAQPGIATVNWGDGTIATNSPFYLQESTLCNMCLLYGTGRYSVFFHSIYLTP